MFLSSSSAGIAAGSWDAYFDLKEAFTFSLIIYRSKSANLKSLKKNLHNH